MTLMLYKRDIVINKITFYDKIKIIEGYFKL